MNVLNTVRRYAWRGLAAVLTMVFFPPSMVAQDLELFSTSSGGVEVLLMWSPDTSQPNLRYNVYRKPGGAGSWPTDPINATPIGPVTNCAQFQSSIPSGSGLWNMISYALGDSTGGTPPITPLSDVCSIVSLTPGSDDWQRVQVFAGYIPQVAMVMGQAYRDVGLSLGKNFDYRVVRVTAGGKELPVLPEATGSITAGSSGSIPTPSSVELVEGDAMIQILWDRPGSDRFQSYEVQRRRTSGGSWIRVSDVEHSANITSTIAQDTVVPAKHGFTDFQRYDETTGELVAHDVPDPPGSDISVNGPFNGTSYRYRVRHTDPLGNSGSWSSVVTGTPFDSTRPKVPQGLIVEANEPLNGFNLEWNVVRLDIKGHVEKIAGYRVYRYDQPENPYAGAVSIGGLIPPPASDTAETIQFADSSGGLRSDCGDKTWYYRIEAHDQAGNVSYRSIAVGDALKDTTRPDDVKGVEAEGFPEFIQVRWDPNNDCDIDEYRIYRAHCNYGDWLPCFDSTYDGPTLERYKDWIAKFRDENPDWSGETQTMYQRYVPPEMGRADIACGGPFAIVGIVPHEEALKRRDEIGKAYFDDMTVPAGSPICYAYIVKAVDKSQNESGYMPIPDPATEIIVCQRLRDKTPPEPAIVSGLLARDSGIVVEWIGPPIQDIAAYHVYRSESENGSYSWVGGRTVVPPPATGTVLSAPYTPPAVVGCDSIPLVSRDWMSAGSIVDTVDPRDTWWYKVLGVDQQGNESMVDSAVGISTFTFKSVRDPAPLITSVTPVEDPCAFEVKWKPTYDSDSAIGFAVFRCKNIAGDYYQVGTIVKGNEYTDRTVARNTTYWYRISMLKVDGSLTQLSEPKKGVHP